jgi:hypothetical protein
MTQMHFGKDFAEILLELSAAGAEFLVVGAHAVAAHGVTRSTKDFDIWVRPTPENARRVWQALLKFGAPIEEVTMQDFAVSGTIFQMGRPPNRIDIITAIRAVDFDEAWPNRMMAKMGGGWYPVIGKDDLIRNKRAVARDYDIADANKLSRVPHQ